jgi:hypothetical protein
MTGILNALIAGVSGAVKDQYFNLVSLLLPGNGTNGAQNNTFLDGSSNNFTITRNGNTTQGTFSPFSQTGWAGYFASSTSTVQQRLTGTLSSAVGAGNFTIEFGLYLTGYNTTAGFVGIFLDQPTGLFLSVNDVGRMLFGQRGGSTIIAASSSTQIPLNTWTWVTLTRSGSAVTLYFNGSSVGTGTSSVNFSDATIYIGGRHAIDTTNWYPFQGYLSNYRISNTVRSAAVPTSPLTSDANTLFLALQNNRFIDSSSQPLTVSGTVSIQAFSPFAPTAAYTTAAVGGSGYFDGTGDYLTWAGSSVGSGAFTFECWFYYTGTFAGTAAFIGPGTATTNALSIQISSSTTIQIDQYGVTATSFTVPTMTANQWYHIVVVRNSGGSCTVFLNGTRSSTGALSITTNFANVAAIGYVSSAVPRHWIGYLAGVTYNSTALYDPTLSTITIPTAPTTAVSGTQLLLNYTNAGITDATAKNDLETVGNAQISTSVSKFGGGSIAFDGNNDSLNGPSSTELDMGTGNWTVEGWINITTRTLNYPLIIGNNNGTFSAGAVAFTASNADSASYNDRFNLAIFDLGVTKLIPATGTANATGTWYHFAVVRNGTNISIYRDGVSVASATVSASLTINWGKGGVRVGGNNWDGAQSYLNGYIDDLRITKGYARYVTGTGANAGQMVFNGTNTLALPTAPFPVQ